MAKIKEKGNAFLNKTAEKLLTFLDKTYIDNEEFGNKNKMFQEIVNREFDLVKGKSNGSIIDMISYIKKDSNSQKSIYEKKDPIDLLTENSGDLFAIFQDLYKNKYIEAHDLKFISKFVPALGEAVNTALNAVFSADAINESILRTFRFQQGIPEDIMYTITSEIEKIEETLKLKSFIKNHIGKPTLITGNVFLYAVPYSKIFSEYKRYKEKKLFHKERQNLVDNKKAIGKACECVSIDESRLLRESLEGKLSNFEKIDTSVLESALNDVNDLLTIKEIFNNDENIKATETVEKIYHTIDNGDNENKSDFNKINGLFYKILDFKNLVPIDIFNERVGYFYIDSTKKTPENTRNKSVQPGVLSNLSLTEKKKEMILNSLVENFSEQILKNFDERFIIENEQFKKTIADCIFYNGITGSYHVQFIPANDIIEFKVKTDENGYGQSILANSLFHAKLYLSLIIGKMLNYMNRSGNKVVAHTYKNSIDLNTANQTQRIIRNLQQSEITTNDILSTKNILTKLSRNGVIFIPTSRDGKKVVEFETMEGQNIDLDTPLEKHLLDMTIMGSSTPSVILQYIDSVDYAKQIESANITYARTISTYQADYEEPLTEFYRRLLSYSSLPDNCKDYINQDFRVSLPRPSILKTINSNEHIENSMRLTSSLTECYTGPEQDIDDPVMKTARKLFIKKTVQAFAPFLDWERHDSDFNEAIIEASKEHINNPKTDSNNGI